MSHLIYINTICPLVFECSSLYSFDLTFFFLKICRQKCCCLLFNWYMLKSFKMNLLYNVVKVTDNLILNLIWPKKQLFTIIYGVICNKFGQNEET